MQSASSRIWTRLAVSFSYDDDHYTTGTTTRERWTQFCCYHSMLFYFFFTRAHIATLLLLLLFSGTLYLWFPYCINFYAWSAQEIFVAKHLCWFLMFTNFPMEFFVYDLNLVPQKALTRGVIWLRKDFFYIIIFRFIYLIFRFS